MTASVSAQTAFKVHTSRTMGLALLAINVLTQTYFSNRSSSPLEDELGKRVRTGCRSVYCKRATDRILPPLVPFTLGLIWSCQLKFLDQATPVLLNGSDNSLYG